MNTNAMTPNEKGKVTTAILAFLKAKAEKERADKECKLRQAEIIEAMKGKDKALWETKDTIYDLTATYGKTRKTLSADLVKKVLKVDVTDDCYSVSSPWNELRIKTTAK